MEMERAPVAGAELINGRAEIVTAWQLLRLRTATRPVLPGIPLVCPDVAVVHGVTLQSDRRQIQLAGALDRGERDCEVLDSESGAVEERDVVVRLTTRRGPREHVAELRHVVSRDLVRFDRLRQV